MAQPTVFALMRKFQNMFHITNTPLKTNMTLEYPACSIGNTSSFMVDFATKLLTFCNKAIATKLLTWWILRPQYGSQK